MKFLIIGLGSMGKRRIRCLLELGIPKEDILGYDLKEERRCEVNDIYGVITIPKLSIPLYKDMVLLVCTPPDKHLQYLQIASDYKIPCFVEASVCLEGLEELENSKYIYPSATMRFSHMVKAFKYEVEEYKDIKNFRYSCKSYLPSWHKKKEENYYAFEKEVNGCKEMIPFELEWLVWIFGEITKITSIHWSSGIFGEFNDCYYLSLEFTSGMKGVVEIDVITKKAEGGKRMMEFFREKDSIYNYIRTDEKMYVREMKHFIASIEGKEQYHYSLEEDIKVLELLEEIER